jgi:hypothetical protein
VRRGMESPGEAGVARRRKARQGEASPGRFCGSVDEAASPAEPGQC